MHILHNYKLLQDSTEAMYHVSILTTLTGRELPTAAILGYEDAPSYCADTNFLCGSICRYYLLITLKLLGRILVLTFGHRVT